MAYIDIVERQPSMVLCIARSLIVSLIYLNSINTKVFFSDKMN